MTLLQELDGYKTRHFLLRRWLNGSARRRLPGPVVYNQKLTNRTRSRALLLCPVSANAQDDKKADYGTVIGIDLGTAYSCVGVQQAGRIEIITNDQGHRLITPSWRLIDLKFNDQESSVTRSTRTCVPLLQPVEYLTRSQATQAYKQRRQAIRYRGDAREFTPEEFSAMVLGKTKETAETYLGKTVTHAVIAVPACLPVLRVINEPTAAAIAYVLEEGRRVAEHLLRSWWWYLRCNLRILGELKHEVEKAKHTLSSQQSTRLEIESFESDNDFSEMLTRAKFQELNMDLLRKTMRPIEQVLKDANLKKEDTDESAEDREHKEPSQGISPNEAVAYVVALQDGILSCDESLGHVVLVNRGTEDGDEVGEEMCAMLSAI
ncbi:hypothetical protein BKA93DRAFT_865776 [Sparassis latifolia]